MKRVIGMAGAMMCLAFAFYGAFEAVPEEISYEGDSNAGFTKFIEDIEPIDYGYEVESIKRTESKIAAIEEIASSLEEIKIADTDIEELAHLVRCEAGNQSLMGKRAVVDVVLNRVDSEDFPDNIHDVIYQTGQFSCVRDGNWEKYQNAVDETDYEAVELELADRTNTEIVYFSSQGCANGSLVYVIGDHYFAKR